MTSSLIHAVSWIEQLLLGRVGTFAAIIAVAWIGFAMLQGRFAARDGMRVILGCFILFGAPLIARGLTGAAHGDAGGVVYLDPDGGAHRPSTPGDFDPYAGAATPM